MMEAHVLAVLFTLAASGTPASANGSNTSRIKEDPLAEMLQHDTMAFFAVLVMICK